MSLGGLLYYLATRAISPFLGLALRRRARLGKEDPARLNERLARDLPDPPAAPLVWLHGASVGESLLLAGLAERLAERRPGLAFLFTSQTLTSANLLASRLPSEASHQMAPLDTPGAARRFIAHWKPALAVFAEGELWPNLVAAADRSGARLALVNARMTQKSLKGWTRWASLARDRLQRFDVILAADRATADGLADLAGRPVARPGNLKSALPPPPADQRLVQSMRREFLGERDCLLAASTHPSEEALLLAAWRALPRRPALILAPRHPERGDEVEALCAKASVSYARRSTGDVAALHTEILLADTMGEMGAWYRLADAVYLGGGHAEGVGGHNPLEAARLDKPVVTGPRVHNFADVFAELETAGAVLVADDADALPGALEKALAEPDVDEAAMAAFFARADAPMIVTLDALQALLPEPAEP